MAKTPLLDLIRGEQAPRAWFQSNVWHEAGLYQALAFVACLVAAYALTLLLRKLFPEESREGFGLWRWALGSLRALSVPLITLLFMVIVRAVSEDNQWPAVVTQVFLKFTEAWLVIQILAVVLLPPGWIKGVIVVVAALFFLQVLGVLDTVLGYMDSMALTFSDQRLSVLEVVQAIVLLAVMLPLINRLCHFIEELLGRVEEVKPRVRVLVSKLLKIGLYTVAFVSAMDLVGINLQMLTVFSGAVGLGIGFGLQKVVSNLVSGVILLLDNSIKPGDVIEVGGAYGWVESMNARFASMVTRDGKAILIPNDDMIANQVVNWSFTGHSVRSKIPVSVAYDTDLKVAMELMLAACQGKDRVLDDPKPRVLLKAFGDDGILLELRVWVQHPQHGMASVASDIQLAIWEAFRSSGISFPFPQRDLHVKEPVTVRLEGAGGKDG